MEADKLKQFAKKEQDKAVSKATAEAANEAGRKARAEADAELVKLRRAVDSTSLWFEDLLETTRSERDRLAGE